MNHLFTIPTRFPRINLFKFKIQSLIYVRTAHLTLPHVLSASIFPTFLVLQGVFFTSTPLKS